MWHINLEVKCYRCKVIWQCQYQHNNIIQHLRPFPHNNYAKTHTILKIDAIVGSLSSSSRREYPCTICPGAKCAKCLKLSNNALKKGGVRRQESARGAFQSFQRRCPVSSVVATPTLCCSREMKALERHSRVSNDPIH